MSRVLLFTRVGAALPKFVARAYESPDEIRFAQANNATRIVGTGYYVSGPVVLRALACDRWWLVECDDADAGRAIITASLLSNRRDSPSVGTLVNPRILASGGRSATEGK